MLRVPPVMSAAFPERSMVLIEATLPSRCSSPDAGCAWRVAGIRGGLRGAVRVTISLMPRKGEVTERALWFGLLGGAIAWLLHLIGEYALSQWGCDSVFQRSRVLGMAGSDWVLLILTLALAAAATFAAAARCGARLRGGTEPDGSLFHGSGRKVARAGRIASSLFAV